jgi:hypothetical protein
MEEEKTTPLKPEVKDGNRIINNLTIHNQQIEKMSQV